MQQLLKSGILLFLLISLLSTAKARVCAFEEKDSFSIEGRWDMAIQMGGKDHPSWLEVNHSGYSTLVGQFVGSSGSARPISRIYFNDKKISFTLPPQWERGTADLLFEGRVEGAGLAGTLTLPDGQKHSWTAVRAPGLRRTKAPVWGTPVQLFNGKDLTGWKALGENQWKAEAGLLRNPKSGSNLVSEARFTDFKLHIEFRYPKGSNSGVYLRGRYEVQISDSRDAEPSAGDLGAVYGFLPPTEQVAKGAGEWQTYDITLVGRMVTVVANGKTVICNREIPGITGGALDSKEGEPGPLLIQGDHGPVDFRNIVLTPAR